MSIYPEDYIENLVSDFCSISNSDVDSCKDFVDNSLHPNDSLPFTNEQIDRIVAGLGNFPYKDICKGYWYIALDQKNITLDTLRIILNLVKKEFQELCDEFYEDKELAKVIYDTIYYVYVHPTFLHYRAIENGVDPTLPADWLLEVLAPSEKDIYDFLMPMPETYVMHRLD